MCAFPNGVHDDRVATMVQALMHFKKRGRAAGPAAGEGKPEPSDAVKAARQKF